MGGQKCSVCMTMWLKPRLKAQFRRRTFCSTAGARLWFRRRDSHPKFRIFSSHVTILPRERNPAKIHYGNLWVLLGMAEARPLNQGHPTDRFGECLFGRPIIAYDFRIKLWWKTGVFFSSNFRVLKNVIPDYFGEIKMSFWVRIKAS